MSDHHDEFWTHPWAVRLSRLVHDDSLTAKPDWHDAARGLVMDIETTTPDLLSALKELGVRFGTLVLASGDFSEANARAIDAANAAIAKAEGKGQAA